MNKIVHVGSQYIKEYYEYIKLFLSLLIKNNQLSMWASIGLNFIVKPLTSINNTLLAYRDIFSPRFMYKTNLCYL
jgi:hypothetical protein